MKKVLVIGCPKCREKHFARKLSAKTGLPLYYLDMIWHKADRTTVSTEEFDTALSEIMNHDRWILDGNYLRTLPMRLEKADTVFFFDLPLDVCLSGAIERLGKERVDMPWKDDVLDEEFRQWITDFPETQLPIINLLLESYGSNVVRFTSRQEADEYIERL